ncbi:MAG TPA: ABC transporter ATP-binding protein [Tepidisphaeraceae bacterium]|jgi:branched-chain amino acid transport system ATP-binding protein
MLLKIENLQVNYGAIRALRGVSLEIAEGEIVTLIGSNGAGKTTLLRTISGLIHSAGGAIWLAPQIALHHARPHEIVALGVSQVPEGRQIFPQMTVRENLSLGAYQRKNRQQIRTDMERMFSLFPILAERRQQRAGTLSGGEQQMLAIGRALMARPKLLLLDEPSLGLAPLVVRKIFQIIREINQAATTIFLVEQNAHMALQVANRAYVMQTGEVIQTGKAADLLKDPQVKAAYLGG